MSVNIFEYAVRNKVRFQFKGLLTAEDLWDLSLTSLDSIYKALNKEKKATEEESLLETKSAADQELEVKIEIVKHVVSVKLEEKAAREQAAENKKQKQKIMEIMAKRQDSALENMSDEELAKKLAELG